MTTIGYHCILELSGCPSHLLDDHELVIEAVRKAAEAADLTLLGEVSHSFTPQGVTALALLAESHISVHTWPELGYAAADVFTCGHKAKPRAACEHLARSFRAAKHQIRKIPRGPALLASDGIPAVHLDHIGVETAGSTRAAASIEPDSDEACLCPARTWTLLSG